MALCPPSFDGLWDTGLIIISCEEITYWYLIHGKPVPGTWYCYFFTSKLARYLS